MNELNGAREELRLIEWDKVLNATANDNWEHLKFMIQQQKYILVVFIPMSCYTLE